jgi:methionine-rich copper-binding protein CopC
VAPFLPDRSESSYAKDIHVMPTSVTFPVRRSRAIRSLDRRRSSSPRVVLGGLVVAVLVTLGSLLWAPAASAHDELLDLQPGNKVVVATPPTEVRMVFSATPLLIGTQLRVTDPKGTVVSVGPAMISGGTVVQKLRSGLVDGAYRVDWRVTAADGHPVSNTYTFTVKAAGAGSATQPAAPSAPASPAAASAAAATPPSSSQPLAVSGGSGGSSSGSSTSAALVVGLTFLVVVLAGGAFAIVRRRSGTSPSNEGNTKK